MKRVWVCILAGLAVVTAGAPAAQEQQFATRPAVETLEQYFDLVVSGNLESAEGLWTRSAIERSNRFGITYTDIPLKIDCSSPVIRNLDVMRDHIYPAAREVQVIGGGGWIRLQYRKVIGQETIEHPYYTYYDGDYFWLSYPQDFYAQDWPLLESEYFRIHYVPGYADYLHPVALEGADRFVERIADSLGLAGEKLDLIRDRKIEYFFCGTDSLVEEITGHRTKGMTDLASNDIISAYFPHHHEVVHLLVAIKLQELPLYTQPMLREGVAVHYGGRWGKAPAALLYLGAYLQEEQLVEIDSLVTMERFEQQAVADMAYPVAGLVVSYLLDRLGRDDFFRLYRVLSGKFDEINQMSAPAVKRILYQAVGTDSWEALAEDFATFAKEVQVDRAVFAPGGIRQERVMFEDDRVRVAMFQRWVSLTFKGAGEAPPAGNLLFGRTDRLDNARSLLFEEQYQKSREFPGYRWGIRFDGNEAGLYDYGTNELVAKYIFFVTPDDSYMSEDGKLIRVKFLVDLADGDTPTRNGHTVLEN